MCLPSPPKQSAPVQEKITPAPPPEPTPTAPVISNEGAGRSAKSSANKSKRSGTRSLQIALNVPGGNTSGSGLSIPS